MSEADRIRRYALDHFIQPARAQARQEITIRAGDLHRQMCLSNAMPAVCAALRSGKLARLAGVTRLSVTGPANGANVYFRFGLTDGPTVVGSLPQTPRLIGSASAGGAGRLDLRDATVLVSCVKTKLPHPAPARDLYCSIWFRKARRLVEAQHAPWFILSAQHGLVDPNEVIAPYERTLKELSIEEQRNWADGVLRRLVPQLRGRARVVFLAGEVYRALLVKPLQEAGWRVEMPMEGLAQGEQLAWLASHA